MPIFIESLPDWTLKEQQGLPMIC